jgi:hypothetical protein
MGTVSASDEQPHAVEGDGQWSESYYFNLYDPKSGLGGFTRIGVRPNEGTMDVGLSFFLPDGGFVHVRHVKPQHTNTSDLEVEGVRYELVKPLERWRLTYDGPSHSLPSARDAGNREAWKKSRLERLIVDLTFDAIHPPAGAGGDRPAPPSGAAAAAAGGVAKGHFEQAGRWSGTVWVSGDEYAIHAWGNRDKSWGVRNWQAPRMWRWFSLNFGDDCAMGAVRLLMSDADVQRGWIYRDGRNVSVRGLELRTETEPGSCIQKTLELTLTDAESRRHVIAGELLNVAPLPQSRNGRKTLVCEGLARFRYEGREGYGIAEYLHQIDGDGQPLVPVE